MANKSIIDVDTAESITQEDLFYVNSNKSLKQIKNKNLKFDYDTHVINKPSINGIELCGGDGKSLNELGIGSSTDIEDLMQTKAGAIINSARGERIAVGDSADAFFEGLKLHGKSEQNGSPTPDNPIPIKSCGDGGEIGINMHGYNLFDASKIQTKSAGGATVTNNGDGSFTISGSGNLSEQFQVEYQLTRKETVSLFKKGKIKGTRSAGAYDTLPYFRMIGRSNSGPFEIIDGTEITDDHLNDESFTISFDFIANKTNTIKPGTVKPMIYQDGNGAFEPFIPLRSTQLSTPNGLPGLPVDSGGNYTDSNGQQWICDEMDFKRGKYVQRVKKVAFDGSKDETWRRENSYVYIRINDSAPLTIPLVNKFVGVKNTNSNANTNNSSTISSSSALTCCLTGITDGELQVWTTYLQTNPIEVLYILSTPIETDIPEETMNAYRKLYTNYPSTVIQNDSGAGMEVEYVADTKSYIDNKLKELIQAAYGNMANMLSLMPTNVQAEMIENDTNNILNNL